MIQKLNLTPKQISFIAALILSIPVASGFAFYSSIWWHPILVFVLMLILNYLVISSLIHQFIYRQIRLIYKMIAQAKATKKEEFYNKNLLPEKTLDEVRDDVKQWAALRKKEMETLHQNEAFRKEFLQNLSHELKTPIFSIQGYVDTLLGGAIENQAVSLKFLQNTEKNIDRLVNLVSDLDEISRLESGEQKLSITTFVIQELVLEIFDSLFLKASEKKIEMSIKRGCESPLVVSADKEKIRQVLVNLIENAIKYGKPSGKVEAGFYATEASNVLIEITDDGYGIAEEHRLRIFERFYRTDTARSRKIGGSGLGLAICKHIIEAHSQEIRVRSTIDIGSTFGFELPNSK